MTRRTCLRITAVAGGVLAAGGLARGFADSKQVTVRATRTLMGVLIHAAVVTNDASAGQATLDSTWAAMQRLIDVFDYRPADSALARLARTGTLTDPHEDLVALLAQARQVSDLSDGAFDVTVQPLVEAYRRDAAIDRTLRKLVDYRQLQIAPDVITLDRPGMAVTLDGVAKGRVIDAAVATLRAHGCTQVLVEAGGDLAGTGTRQDGRPWRVGVTHPRTGGVLAEFDLPGGAMATSGDYVNYFSQDYRQNHIIDPRTGASPPELASVSVIAPTAAEADALSTTLMVLGLEQGQKLVAQWPKAEALFITKTLEQVRTPGFPVSHPA
jgi:thiamine biosynthesis lipoprotein